MQSPTTLATTTSLVSLRRESCDSSGRIRHRMRARRGQTRGCLQSGGAIGGGGAGEKYKPSGCYSVMEDGRDGSANTSENNTNNATHDTVLSIIPLIIIIHSDDNMLCVLMQLTFRMRI